MTVRAVVVVTRRSDWPETAGGPSVVSARDYLTDGSWAKERGVRVYNLCRSYRYQSEGYYVSLLAAARRHRPFPDLMTVLDMKSRALVRAIDDELDELTQKSFADLRSKRFELSVYFGRNVASRHNRLARRIFTQFPAPLLRATFLRGERWRLSAITPIALRDVPDEHRDVLSEAAREYFAKPPSKPRRSKPTRYDLAILHAEGEELSPSDDRALARFRRAAEELGFGVELIDRDDYPRIGAFDALFIRETTYVNHHTFRFAQRAEAEGLVVIDDPHSILCCTNKVFQTEAFEQAKVPTPKTLITDAVDLDEVAETIGFPCVLKLPDSSFSQGVVKCADREELEREAAAALERSDLVLLQEFMPSDYDWRVGLFGGQPLYACRYHMARGHWQIVKKTEGGSFRYGRVEPVALEAVPAGLLEIALRAAATIGDGLYGVDLKQVGDRVVVTEVNDNPNIDAGCEDALLGDELYRRIMQGFLDRIEARKRDAVR